MEPEATDAMSKISKETSPAQDEESKPDPHPREVTLEGEENPRNWSTGKKSVTYCLAWLFTLFTPLASSMCAPSISLVMREFHTTSEQYGAFVLSVYVLGLAFGPLVIAPFSEMYGRLIVYHVCNTIFMIFIVGCAVSDSIGMLTGFRFLAGLFGSCPVTLSAGTVGDMVRPERRGLMVGIMILGPLIGPAIGPVIGGFLAQAKGWRWIYWLIIIVWGFTLLVSFVFMRETYAPYLLRRKIKKLQKESPEKIAASGPSVSTLALLRISVSRPIKLLCLCPDVFCLSLYTTFVYGVYYIFLTSMTLTFEGVYGFGAGVVGLTYIGVGIGACSGMLICSYISDRIVARMSKGGEIKPHYRLPPLIPSSLFTPIGLFWFGWSVEAKVHWIVPIIGTVFIGIGVAAGFMPIAYLVDAYPRFAASAMAANALLRSVGGAVLPLSGPSLYRNLGQGWGNSLLAFISLLVCPMTVALYKYGERLRQMSASIT